MLEITRIRENKDQIVEALKIRNIDVADQINKIIDLDSEWRKSKAKLEEVAAESNKIAKEIGKLFI